VVPTRELGEQVAKAFKPFTHTTRLRVRALLGGTTMEVAKRSLQGAFEVLVATPGRLIKMMDADSSRSAMFRTLVLDEADQMLDHGFLPDVRRIVKECPAERQLAMFSATVPLLSRSSLRISLPGGSHPQPREPPGCPDPQHHPANGRGGKRFPLLEQLLGKKVEGGTILFTNTREQCDKLADELVKAGWPCVIYRGDMDKTERRRNLKMFREGGSPPSDLYRSCLRGLDVEHVGRVINYHMPQQMENYLHRVGRTARAGRSGLVVNFVTERDVPLMRKLDDVRSSSKPSLAPKPTKAKR